MPEAVVTLLEACEAGCHATVLVTLGKVQEKRQIDMEQFLALKEEEINDVDQVMLNLKTAMKIDGVTARTLGNWLKQRSFKI